MYSRKAIRYDLLMKDNNLSATAPTNGGENQTTSKPHPTYDSYYALVDPEGPAFGTGHTSAEAYADAEVWLDGESTDGLELVPISETAYEAIQAGDPDAWAKGDLIPPGFKQADFRYDVQDHRDEHKNLEDLEIAVTIDFGGKLQHQAAMQAQFFAGMGFVGMGLRYGRNRDYEGILRDGGANPETERTDSHDRLQDILELIGVTEEAEKVFDQYLAREEARNETFEAIPAGSRAVAWSTQVNFGEPTAWFEGPSEEEAYGAARKFCEFMVDQDPNPQTDDRGRAYDGEFNPAPSREERVSELADTFRTASLADVREFDEREFADFSRDFSPIVKDGGVGPSDGVRRFLRAEASHREAAQELDGALEERKSTKDRAAEPER